MRPRIPESGELDLQPVHPEEGRKFLAAYTVLGVITVVANAVLGQADRPLVGWRLPF